MVLAFAGDSTTTSAFAISISTLARSVNPDVSATACALDEALQLQLEKPRQKALRREAGLFRNCVQIAGFTGGNACEHHVIRGRIGSSLHTAAGPGPPHSFYLFQDIVRGLDDLCTVTQQRVPSPISPREDTAWYGEHV